MFSGAGTESCCTPSYTHLKALTSHLPAKVLVEDTVLYLLQAYYVALEAQYFFAEPWKSVAPSFELQGTVVVKLSEYVLICQDVVGHYAHDCAMRRRQCCPEDPFERTTHHAMSEMSKVVHSTC